MLTRPNRRMLQALIELSSLPAWKEVDKLLREELDKTHERLVSAGEMLAVGKAQGRAALLGELLSTVATAAAELPKAPM